MRPAIRSGRAGAKSRLSAGESDGRRSRVPPPARLQTPLRKSGPINRQRSCVRGTGNEPGPIRLQNQSGLQGAGAWLHAACRRRGSRRALQAEKMTRRTRNSSVPDRIWAMWFTRQHLVIDRSGPSIEIVALRLGLGFYAAQGRGGRHTRPKVQFNRTRIIIYLQ